MASNKLQSSSEESLSKKEVLKVLRKAKNRLVWVMAAASLISLIGFIVVFLLTRNDKRWSETLQNFQQNNLDYWGLEQTLSRDRSNFWLGSLWSYSAFAFLVLLPLLALWSALTAFKIFRTFDKKLEESSDTFEVELRVRSSAKKMEEAFFSLGFLRFFGYEFKIFEEVAVSKKQPQELSSSTVFSTLRRRNWINFFVFFLIFVILRVLTSAFLHSFTGVFFFTTFPSLNFSFKIFLILLTWLFIEMFVLWFWVMSFFYLSKVPNKKWRENIFFLENNKVNWSQFFRGRKPKISLPLVLNFSHRKTQN